MQNRLDTIKQQQAGQEAQLAEVRKAIETERKLRPESVRLPPRLHVC